VRKRSKDSKKKNAREKRSNSALVKGATLPRTTMTNLKISTRAIWIGWKKEIANCKLKEPGNWTNKCPKNSSILPTSTRRAKNWLPALVVVSWRGRRCSQSVSSRDSRKSKRRCTSNTPTVLN
jgi:hypothetical protein